jgi:hypothetical protein
MAMKRSTANKKQPKSRGLSRAAVRRLLSETSATEDRELSESVGWKHYTLPNGSELVVRPDGGGRLWEKRDELVELLKEVRELKPHHFLTGLLPQGQGFMDSVPGLLDTLPQILRTDPAKLDKSQESLDIVDKAMRRLGYARVLEPKVIAPLIAYVGEVVRAATNGSWEMRLGSDGKTWEPWVVDPRGEEYGTFFFVGEIINTGRLISLRGHVEGQLGAARLYSMFRKETIN